MIKYAMKGADAASKKAKKMAEVFDAARARAVQDATLAIHRKAVKSIQENSDGTPTKRYNPPRLVNVSNPGDPPNTDTGRLVQSIKVEFEDDGAIGLVGSNLKYAAWLEFGTENMRARPWLSAAVTATSKEVAKIFSKWFKKAVEKAVS